MKVEIVPIVYVFTTNVVVCRSSWPGCTGRPGPTGTAAAAATASHFTTVGSDSSVFSCHSGFFCRCHPNDTWYCDDITTAAATAAAAGWPGERVTGTGGVWFGCRGQMSYYPGSQRFSKRRATKCDK